MIKILNAKKDIELSIESNESLIMDDPITWYKEKSILKRFIEGIVESVQVSNLSRYPHDCCIIGSPL